MSPQNTKTLVWAAVPAGRSGSKLKLSAVVFPRLYVAGGGTAPLDAFQDMLNWPGRQEGVQFGVDLGGTVVTAKRVLPRKPDMTTWMALFPRETAVQSFTLDPTIPQRTLAHPAARIYQYLRNLYQRVGIAYPWAAPATSALVTEMADLAASALPKGQRSKLLKETHDAFQALGYADDLNFGESTPSRDWLLARLFFRPPYVIDHGDGTASYTFDPPPTAGDPPPDTGNEEVPLEFHTILGALFHHPDLMRAFGLVVDLTVDAPSTMPETGLVRLVPKWSPNSKVPTTDATPATHYGSNFLAAPRPHDPEDIADGLIDLSRGRYHMIPVDLDTAVNKIQRMVETVQRGVDATLPPLDTGAVAVVRQSAAQRTAEYAADYNQPATRLLRETDPGKMELFAEDLLVGYRLDVTSDTETETPAWYSLHRRNATYQFTRNSKAITQQFVNEGWVMPGTTETGLLPDVSPAPGDPAYQPVLEQLLPPSITRWDGWSLSVPRTLLPLRINPEVRFGVGYTAVPGSLPWLRIGMPYHFRLRTVDFAGNGLAPDAPGMRSASQKLVYRRWEPITTPVVIAAATLPDGRSVSRLVIRTFDSALGRPAEADVRHFAPPTFKAELAERLGMFDQPDGTIDGAGLAQAGELEKKGPPDKLAAGTTLVADYLTDPQARGVALQNVPGSPGIVRVDFGTDWPARKGFEVRLHPGAAGWDWNPSARVLTVSLPPGETVRVPYSSYLNEQDLNQMELWHLLAEGLSRPGDAARLAQLRQGMMDGRHWMLTPGRELVLIHAVQRPLVSPDFATIGASRGQDETTASFSGALNVDGKTTGLVAVKMQWLDVVDDPLADGPVWIGGSGHAFETYVHKPSSASIEINSKFDFRDTRYRRVICTATATTRFTDFFKAEDLANPSDLTLPGVPVELDVLNTARPAPPKVLYAVPTFGWEKPPASGTTTTSIRWGGGLRVYLDRPWYSTGDGEMLAVVLLDTPQSRLTSLITRPEVPDKLKPWVTLWGADPLWRSRDTYPVPKLEHFKSAQVTQNGFSLAELGGAGDVKVAVAGHTVEYDKELGLWYADIEVDAGPAYFPFIQLALARYQPKSVGDRHLSPVVTADIMQTAPHRTATVTRSGSQLMVAVSGETYSAGRAGSAVVEAELQFAVGDGSGDDLNVWHPVTDSLTTLQRHGFAWTGAVSVPSESGKTYRLIIREYEQLPGDTGVVRRLVYADIIGLK